MIYILSFNIITLDLVTQRNIKMDLVGGYTFQPHHKKMKIKKGSLMRITRENIEEHDIYYESKTF